MPVARLKYLNMCDVYTSHYQFVTSFDGVIYAARLMIQRRTFPAKVSSPVRNKCSGSICLLIDVRRGSNRINKRTECSTRRQIYIQLQQINTRFNTKNTQKLSCWEFKGWAEDFWKWGLKSMRMFSKRFGRDEKWKRVLYSLEFITSHQRFKSQIFHCRPCQTFFFLNFLLKIECELLKIGSIF